jgi:hypothetical protein
MCELCHGEVILLGVLGNRCHGRCRDCGLDQSFVVPEDAGEEAEVEVDCD